MMKIVLHLTIIIMEMIANSFYLKTPKQIIKKKFNCEAPAISFSIRSLQCKSHMKLKFNSNCSNNEYDRRVLC